jgi:hypothetical protein
VRCIGYMKYSDAVGPPHERRACMSVISRNDRGTER